jgi:hypothetical protein
VSVCVGGGRWKECDGISSDGMNGMNGMGWIGWISAWEGKRELLLRLHGIHRFMYSACRCWQHADICCCCCACRGAGWGPLRRAPVQHLDFNGRPGLLRTVLEAQVGAGGTCRCCKTHECSER